MKLLRLLVYWWRYWAWWWRPVLEQRTTYDACKHGWLDHASRFRLYARWDAERKATKPVRPRLWGR